jgi:16S rRNA (cytosine967-C5)-methyltransferase
MFIQAYLNTAQEILKKYAGEEPFSSFLKKYFKEHKQFGSRDRKQIAHLCYCFFRLGKSLRKYGIDERLGIAVYLCNTSSSPVLEKVNPQWNEQIELKVDEKIDQIKTQYDFKLKDIFPWRENFSELLDYDSFIKSFFIQPQTFLRIRPGKEINVKQNLAVSNISFHSVTDHCVAVAPATKLDEVIELNKEAVIQDLNSQQVLDPLIKYIQGKNKIKTAWDCCAASGGKSILLKDHFPALQLTVSDIRESILINLTKRLAQAGIAGYKKMVADIAQAPLKLQQKFDLIVCDAPCSGSGTWSRTPEQLYFFDENKIEYYSGLQKKIVSNVVKSLQTGGFLVYITCSVFKNENEEVAEFIQEQLSLQLINMEYLKGYHQKADSLFTALFTL